MSDKMQWEEPPEMPTNSGRVQRFVEELKKRPGEWAKDPKAFTQSVITTIRRKTFPGTEWTSRKQPDGSYHVWGRWIGK